MQALVLQLFWLAFFWNNFLENSSFFKGRVNGINTRFVKIIYLPIAIGIANKISTLNTIFKN